METTPTTAIKAKALEGELETAYGVIVYVNMVQWPFDLYELFNTYGGDRLLEFSAPGHHDAFVGQLMALQAFYNCAVVATMSYVAPSPFLQDVSTTVDLTKNVMLQTRGRRFRNRNTVFIRIPHYCALWTCKRIDVLGGRVVGLGAILNGLVVIEIDLD